MVSEEESDNILREGGEGVSFTHHSLQERVRISLSLVLRNVNETFFEIFTELELDRDVESIWRVQYLDN